MELWDDLMRPLKPDFDRLNPASRLKSAATVIKWTLEHFSPPVREDETRDLITGSLASFESALQQGVNAVHRTSELDERIELVLDGSAEPGTSNLVMACVQTHSHDSELKGKRLFNVFGSCYNAVLEQEFPGPLIDIEDEVANPRCRETIAFQQDVLQQSLWHKGR
ncbi:hypothetical protein [Glycomyces buryatensis]|uniref:Uncharacterized protein n=1 Tax=Glycomyces buryatensis TaxID=2570927 RepID=A0A4S8QE82_9ACTN|nr:hypothetical protein [Glycomyces buryatensis]THV41215.1 hypothetical protein FAB82_12725 [Glycomyces buryatensis]